MIELGLYLKFQFDFGTDSSVEYLLQLVECKDTATSVYIYSLHRVTNTSCLVL